jgi:transcriptional regulator with XRE-family HTH domain
MSISPEQCRAARALLDWSRDEIADRAKVAKRTLVDFERGARSAHHSTLLVVRQAFEAAGVIFIDGNGDGPGVRLRGQR